MEKYRTCATDTTAESEEVEGRVPTPAQYGKGHDNPMKFFFVPLKMQKYLEDLSSETF